MFAGRRRVNPAQTLSRPSCAAWVLALALVMAAAAPAHGGGATVAATKHNLTSSGPGTVKTSANTEVCIFCHTPHASSPAAPLWNRDDPGTSYQKYASTTLKAVVDQPSGSSRLCLSCHDGTIALGQTFNSMNVTGAGTVFISAQDRGYLGTDLTDDHPISFIYDSDLAARNGQLHDPHSISPELPLEGGQYLQCTTCHDAHDDTRGKFLRMDNQGSRLCISCHAMTDWAASSHATSAASMAGASKDHWTNLSVTTVRDAGCESCHRPHSAGGRQRLLRFEAEESNCVNCHDGSVAATDIAHELTKLSTHPVDNTTGAHDPTENPATMNTHVECADCHEPHRMTSGTAVAPALKPAMKGVSGISGAGSTVNPAQFEYQVCYKCHSQRNFATPVVNRVLGTNNIADEFSPSGQSYHPVEAVGRNTFVPSLLQPYQTSTVIYCTSCHGSDNASGPKGPHGSAYRPLLIANYTTGDHVTETPQAYALCYKCHNRASILNDESFKEHHEHIVDERAACSVCHDPHGVRENAKLINFDRTIVSPTTGTHLGPSYTNLGRGRGACTLSCHGKQHNNLSY